MNLARCAVCGWEGPADRASSTRRRSRETGEITPNHGRPLLFFDDGAVASCCNRHSADEARTALVLHGLAVR